MTPFINNAIHNGIQNYLNTTEEKDINQVHIFEFWVVKVLARIYGETDIVNPFKLGIAKSLRQNLMMYGLTAAQLDQFINLMDEYDKWLNSPVLVSKTDIPTKIDNLLISMIILKGTYQKITAEDIEFYNSYFDPLEGDIAKLRDLIVSDKTITPRLWRIKRSGFEDGLILEEIEPILLPASDYKRYGLNINEVKQLSNLKIREINEQIQKADAESSEGEKEFDPKKLILTSGSGFVDTIMLLGIMATEILVGLIIAFIFMRR